MKDLVLRGGRQQPMSGFRERYHYSNNMFVAAGLVAEAVAGQPFATVLHQRILDPLGMSSTRVSIQEALATPNRASPHDLTGDRVVPARWDRWPDSTLLPTGGVSSTARDMAQWLRFHLGRGALDKRQVVATMAFDQMHVPHTPVRGGPVEAAYWFAHVDAADLQTRHWAYGLGWFVTDYRNQPLVWHGGTVNGFRCAIAMLPELQLGMYVGVNRITLLPPAVMLTVLDRLIGGKGRDWNSVFLREAGLQAEDAAKGVAARQAARATGTNPSLALERYQGRYVNPAIGPMMISSVNGRLTARVGPFRGELTHWHYDTFELAWSSGAKTFLTFALDGQGRPTAALVESLGEFTATP
jgi:CubicO group peptidase (beta-lactamase class C family)